jgi:site-specific DNA-methyltransferase (adenine-specific)
MNKLYFGDNLHVLRKYVPDESVDLIYLDPPFNSKADYNVLFRAASGRGHRAQIQAFEDSWHWGDEAEEALDEIRSHGGAAASIVRALREALGPSDMMAYLVMMDVRLGELHRVLKADGSLFLHCDPTASHYLKIILDAIFGATNFRSEIIWRRSSSHNSATRQFGPVHDSILCFAKSESFRIRPVFTPHSRTATQKKFRFSDDKGAYRLNEIMGPGRRTGDSGEPWRGFDPGAKQRHWAIPESLRELLPDRGTGMRITQQLEWLLDAGEVVVSASGRPEYKQRMTAGVPLQDIWAFQPGTEGCLYGSEAAIDEDVRWLGSDAERLGYPTQKPLGILERIVASATDDGGLVLDPFCGCGTTVHAAQKLGRRWIGIDITHVAIQVIADRLQQWMPSAQFEIIGQPRDLAGAEELARLDKYQFQWWATWLCGGQPAGGGKKGADGGVDGTLEFATGRGRQDWGIISVKGGRNVGVDMVRQLEWAVRNEGATLGVLITLAEPTREMEKAAVTAGLVDLGGERYRRIQIRTIEQLLDGKAIESPYLLTTVQEAPAKSTRGAGNRVPLSPADALAQRNILLPISGGRSKDAQVSLPLDEPLLTAQPVSAPRRRRRA